MRESDELWSWSQNEDFWESLDRCQATNQSLMDIELELRNLEHEKTLIENAINRNCRANFQFAEDHFLSLPPRREEYAFQEVSRASGVFKRHEELREKETAARKLQTEQWAHLLGVAEYAFIEGAILGRMEEEEDVEEEQLRQEQPGSQGPQPEEIRKSNSEISREGVRENHRAAKEACRKAREEFEGARIFSEEEIEQLPQPVNEDMLGVARVMKLERLTHAFNNAEEAYRDARKKAREAGIIRPHEQTADSSDRSDDGYAESVLQKAVTQG